MYRITTLLLMLGMSCMGYGAVLSLPASGKPPVSEKSPVEISGPSVSLTQNTSPGVILSGGPVCINNNYHTENAYLRRFDLDGAHDLTGQLMITSVGFGIYSATNSGNNPQPLSINLYRVPNDSTLVYANLSLLGTTTISVNDGTTNTFFNVPVTGTIDTESDDLVVEIFLPDGRDDGNLIYVANNDAGESAPSYLASAVCGSPEPTTLASIGFNDFHIIMVVYGEQLLPASASLTCNGVNLEVTITDGDAPFMLSTNPNSQGIITRDNLDLGTHVFSGPARFQEITLTESAGDNEILSLGEKVCGADISLNPESGFVTTESGGTDSFETVLRTQPEADVSISIYSTDTTEVTVSPQEIIFTPDNWNVSRTITLSGVEDSVDDNDQSCAVGFQVTSTDLVYNTYPLPSFQGTNLDNDPLFNDVPIGYWAYDGIQALMDSGITSGCSATAYCPGNEVSRAQMAIFLERGMHGGDFIPPPASGNVFNDVPDTHWAAAWIENLYADGITSGCGNGDYCPENSVSRAEMAVFLLKSRHGPDYVPPAATGTRFDDVPAEFWAAGWIEELATEGITQGCDPSNYCPNDAVRRDAMAIFLMRTFDL